MHSDKDDTIWKLGWLAVNIRQIQRGSQGLFFLFYIIILVILLKYETIETHVLTFLAHFSFSWAD